MSAPKPLQLMGKNGNQYEVFTGDISKILDKIGNKNVAIVSINGNKRTGKSFLLNYFLRYLKYNKSHGNQWINGVNEEILNGFHWRGGAERDTVGIWMWSEPYIVKDKYGNDIALILMDTQGNFDEKTTFQECSVIFSLSVLMSTTLILNIKSDLSEDKLQFVEFFTTFAESFNGETRSKQALFQKLVFLLRDWENNVDYQFGYHDQKTPKSKNYMREVVTSNSKQCVESQKTRKEILRYFYHVSSYLMPHPGRQVSLPEFKGQTELMESDFVENIEKFVPLMLESSNIEPKKIGGQLLTGNILKQYLTKWAEVIRTQKIPEAKSLTAATAVVNYMLALEQSVNLYNNNIKACIESEPTDKQLCSLNETAKQKSIDYFTNEPKVRISDDRKAQMVDDLNKRMEDVFVILRANNNYRIDKEEIKRKLNAAISEQLRMTTEMYMKNKENKKNIEDLQSKISDMQNESKRKQAEQEQRFKEESNRMRQNMDHQKAEQRKLLADLEQSYAQQTSRNNEFNEQKLREFAEQKRVMEESNKKMKKTFEKQLNDLQRSHAQQRENLLQRSNDLIQKQIQEFEGHRRLVEQSNREMEERLEEQRQQIERERENANRVLEIERRYNAEVQQQMNAKIKKLENRSTCALQ